MEEDNICVSGINPEEDTLIDAFDAYAVECESALDITLVRIKNVQRHMRRLSGGNPFDRIEARLKTFESTIDKCRRRNYEESIESIREHICDIAGIRIVTKYKDEIAIVANLIEHIPGINIVKRKDYVANPKENGYSSLHLGCQVEIYTPAGGKLIPVEIQIRSKSMNLWASIEHDIKYKRAHPDPRVEGYFKRIARILDEFDEVSMELRDYSAKYDLVADINEDSATGDFPIASAP